MSAHSPHFAKNLFFGCMDDRLVPHDTKFIDGVGGAFRPTFAGGAAAFLNDQDRECALKQVLAAHKINDITDVYLQSHTDCGAYRLSGVTFDDLESEIEHMYNDLDAAAAVVNDALSKAGAKDKVKVHVRLVDPAGQPHKRPVRTKVAA